jgi:Putative transposase, YhgA-like
VAKIRHSPVKHYIRQTKLRENAMPNKLNNAEDKLFKATFSRPIFARELLLRCASPAILQALRLDFLELSNASYVDDELSEHFADLVFTCRTHGEEEAKVSFLLEHKSYVPPYPPLQIIRYQSNGWQQQIKSKLKPAPILPVLFYHGKKPWKALPWKDYLAGMAPGFEPFTPTGNYILIDLADLSDDEIQQFRYGFLKTALFLMKHRFEKQYVFENLKDILIFVEEEVEIEIRNDDLHLLIKYLRHAILLTWDEIEQQIRSLHKISSAMTALEEFKIEFKEEGLKEGIKEGYALKTREMLMYLLENLPEISDEKLAKAAKVEVDYVLQMRLDIAKAKKSNGRKRR